MNLFPPHTRWDIFCKVIDNYGDIGVCWRLARQLANEQQQQVRLWVDDLKSFQKIHPTINPQLTNQQNQHITINQWPKEWQAIEIADIVIEAFGCTIPDCYIQTMAKANKPILWLNLEYLTYEDWAINYHELPSLQANGLNKYFFFMGLPQTGGLIREALLLEQAEQFQHTASAQQTFLNQLGITKQPVAYLMLIFSYANKALGSWLETLQQADQPYHLLIPQTPLIADLADYLHISSTQLTAGYHYQQGSLTLQIIPFIEQTDFDKLLWSTNFNLIRGEDSFIRAQYAGKPMLWHIYPQQQDAHLTKLQAFLNHYLTDLSADAKQATLNWWLAWNNQQDLTEPWNNYQKHLPELQKQAKIWSEKQKTTANLTTKLAKFYKNWLS